MHYGQTPPRELIEDLALTWDGAECIAYFEDDEEFVICLCWFHGTSLDAVMVTWNDGITSSVDGDLMNIGYQFRTEFARRFKDD